jgi:hypothetical protein
MCVYDVHKCAQIVNITLTNSTASSTSDVSCRSNPNVSSYGANTNMSSEISSMFYGAVLHVNTLNVNVYTNPHNCLVLFDSVGKYISVNQFSLLKWVINLSVFSSVPNLLRTLARIVDMYLLPSHVYNLYTYYDVCDIN